jgi:hypothetical protein
VPFAISHAQSPKYGETDVKITVPIRKTTMPIRLNLMNRIAQVITLSRSAKFMIFLLI